MKLSIVIPAYNEAENIGSTLAEIKERLKKLPDVAAAEIIVVDDSSTDSTFEKVGSLADPGVRAIRLSRRSGSHIALRAGLDAAAGDVVLCISADGQDDPEVLAGMLAKWRNGHDIVWALRAGRENEPLHIRVCAGLFYRLLTWFGGATSRIDLSRADFYLLDRKVVNSIKACTERNTSLFGLIAWLGFNQGAVEYERRQRRAGKSKWSFRSRVQLAKDWIIAFSGIPLKLITVSGFCIAGTGFLYALFVIFRSLTMGSPLLGWASVMTAILILGGGQILMLGIIGEYLWRTLDESRDRPTYFVERDTHRKQGVLPFSRRKDDLSGDESTPP